MILTMKKKFFVNYFSIPKCIKNFKAYSKRTKGFHFSQSYKFIQQEEVKLSFFIGEYREARELHNIFLIFFAFCGFKSNLWRSLKTFILKQFSIKSRANLKFLGGDFLIQRWLPPTATPRGRGKLLS